MYVALAVDCNSLSHSFPSFPWLPAHPLPSAASCLREYGKRVTLTRIAYCRAKFTSTQERVFAVNTVGIFRVQRAFFPLLRRGAGVTVLLSSEVALAGAATAFTGPYAASKMALEALATSLRQELSMLDPPLPVVVMNPGATSTPMLDAAIDANFTKHIAAGSVWAGALARGCAAAQSYMRRHARPASTVADAIVAAVRATSPPQRVIVNASWEMWILAFLPQRLIDFVIHRCIGPAMP